MRAATRVNIPLSTLRDGSPPHQWEPTDRLLLEALQILDDGTCNGCGQPIDDAWGTDASYEVPVTVCAGCAALHQHHENNKHPEPGEKPYLVPESGSTETQFAPVFE